MSSEKIHEPTKLPLPHDTYTLDSHALTFTGKKIRQRKQARSPANIALFFRDVFRTSLRLLAGKCNDSAHLETRRRALLCCGRDDAADKLQENTLNILR